MRKLGRLIFGFLAVLGVLFLVLLAHALVTSEAFGSGTDCTGYTCKDAQARNLNCSPGTNPCGSSSEPSEGSGEGELVTGPDIRLDCGSKPKLILFAEWEGRDVPSVVVQRWISGRYDDSERYPLTISGDRLRLQYPLRNVSGEELRVGDHEPVRLERRVQNLKCPVVAPCPLPEPDPAPAPTPPDDLIFAHFADSVPPGSNSEIVVVNVSATPVQPALHFFDSSGMEIVVEEAEAEVEPGDSWSFSTGGNLRAVGSVSVKSDGAVAAYLLWSIHTIGTTALSPSVPALEVVVEANPELGFALRNLAPDGQVVSCSIGERLELIDLPENGHSSQFVKEVFGQVSGDLRCSAEHPFAAAAADFQGSDLVSVPVVSVR